MELNVELVCLDLLSGKENTIADGKGILSDRTLSYAEKENPHCLHRVTFSEEKIILKRSAEFSSETVLPVTGKGQAVVHSPYGDMVLDAVLEEFIREDDLWMAEYRIVSGDQTVTRQRLTWKLTKKGKCN